MLRELRERGQREGRSLGQLASELLARALKEDPRQPEAGWMDGWVAVPMGARVDLEDAEALQRRLDSP